MEKTKKSTTLSSDHNEQLWLQVDPVNILSYWDFTFETTFFSVSLWRDDERACVRLIVFKLQTTNSALFQSWNGNLPRGNILAIRFLDPLESSFDTQTFLLRLKHSEVNSLSLHILSSHSAIQEVKRDRCFPLRCGDTVTFALHFSWCFLLSRHAAQGPAP